MKKQTTEPPMAIPDLSIHERQSKLLQAFKEQDDSLVTFTNLQVEYQNQYDIISITFGLKANDPRNEIWSISPMVMASFLPATIYSISQVLMGGQDGSIPFGVSLTMKSNSSVPVTEAIKGKTVQVGVAGFIWTEESPWGMFSSKTIDLYIG